MMRLPPIDPDVSMMIARAVLGSFFSSFCTNSTGSTLYGRLVEAAGSERPSSARHEEAEARVGDRRDELSLKLSRNVLRGAVVQHDDVVAVEARRAFGVLVHVQFEPGTDQFGEARVAVLHPPAEVEHADRILDREEVAQRVVRRARITAVHRDGGGVAHEARALGLEFDRHPLATGEAQFFALGDDPIDARDRHRDVGGRTDDIDEQPSGLTDAKVAVRGEVHRSHVVRGQVERDGVQGNAARGQRLRRAAPTRVRGESIAEQRHRAAGALGDPHGGDEQGGPEIGSAGRQ
jgi:hypothetical protein